MQRREDGNVVVGLKRVWSDGTSALVFSPSELVERLVDGFACPGCGGPLALRCVVVNPPATRRILDGLRRATGPPVLDAAVDDRKA